MAKADFKFHASLRVRWMESDAQGIVYFGAYMDYLEVAWSEYFRNLGVSIYRVAQKGYFDTAGENRGGVQGPGPPRRYAGAVHPRG